MNHTSESALEIVAILKYRWYGLFCTVPIDQAPKNVVAQDQKGFLDVVKNAAIKNGTAYFHYLGRRGSC